MQRPSHDFTLKAQDLKEMFQRGRKITTLDIDRTVAAMERVVALLRAERLVA